MPVNSFENYYMSWRPEKSRLEKPYYLSIAKLLEEDILSGSLPENTKLPPQRELADFLDLNLSTVTRAYKICGLKGLLYAVTGSGTFVAPGTDSADTFLDRRSRAVEMGIIKPFYEMNKVIADEAKTVLARTGAVSLLEYSDPLGTDRHRRAAAKWLERNKIEVSPDHIMIAAGAQNALSVILISLFSAGDKIAVDEFTYTNFRGLANLLHIQLIAVEADRCGIKPAALLSVCKNSGIKGIYLMPTCSNPTGVFMPQDRRDKLADIIRKYRLFVIEDDIYSFLAPDTAKPFFSILPEQTVHICSISKSLCTGLRVAFMAFPERFREKLVSGMLNINLKTVSINAEIIAELIESGKAEEIVEKKIELARKRNQIYRGFFPEESNEPGEGIVRFFYWLRLPSGLSSEEAEILALQAGVRVLGSHRFAMGSSDRSAYIRVSAVSPDSEEELAYGLKQLKKVLDERKISVMV